MKYYGGSDYRDYLAHHGILGQRYGVRNGHPYPLGGDDHSASEKKAGWKKSLNGRLNVSSWAQNRDRDPDSHVVKQRKVNRKIRSGANPEYLKGKHTIPKGTTIYRTSTDQNESVSGEKYISYLENDRQHYRSGWVRKIQGKDKAYEHKYKLKEDIKVPSRDELYEVISQVTAKDKKLQEETVKTWLDMKFKKGSEERLNASLVLNEKTGYYEESEKKWKSFAKERLEEYKNMPVSEMRYFTARTFGKNKKVRSEVINELKKRGYNAMRDEASVGGQSTNMLEGSDPLILFDASIMQRVGTKEIGKNAETSASKKYKKWFNKAMRSGA